MNKNGLSQKIIKTQKKTVTEKMRNENGIWHTKIKNDRIRSIITLNVKYIKLSKQKAEICTMDTMLSTRHFLSKTQTD